MKSPLVPSDEEPLSALLPDVEEAEVAASPVLALSSEYELEEACARERARKGKNSSLLDSQRGGVRSCEGRVRDKGATEARVG